MNNEEKDHFKRFEIIRKKGNFFRSQFFCVNLVNNDGTILSSTKKFLIFEDAESNIKMQIRSIIPIEYTIQGNLSKLIKRDFVSTSSNKQYFKILNGEKEVVKAICVIYQEK